MPSTTPVAAVSGDRYVRSRPQGVGVARDVSAPRIGVLRRRGGTERSAITTGAASLAATQNGTSVAFVRSTRGIEPDVRKSDSTIQSRRCGVLGRRSQLTARPLE